MKTAVEFLINEIPNTIRYALEEEGVIEQAKAMEKEQIINEHLEKLIDRNYAAQIKRGQITMKQTLNDFLNKIDEEVKEFKNSHTNDGYFENIDDKELIDIMLVCFSMAKHFGIDWQKVMTEKVEYNETRGGLNMNKQDITKRYFIRLGHIKNYVDNYKPKSKSEIAQNLHIDNRLIYHLEIDNIIKFNTEINHFVWNDKIPITNKLAETIGLKVTKSNTTARQKQRARKKVKVSFFRRIINWLF